MNLPELYTKLRLSNKDLWGKFAASGDWENIPTDIVLTPFQKVLVIWAIKPDKLYSSILKAAAQILGDISVFQMVNLIIYITYYILQSAKNYELLVIQI